MQVGKRALEFVRGCQVEASSHSYVTDPRPNHVGLRNRRQRHRVASNIDRFDFAGRDMFDRDFYFSAQWSNQELAYFGKSFAAHRLAIDFNHLVAEAQSRARSRSSLKCRTDESV